MHLFVVIAISIHHTGKSNCPGSLDLPCHVYLVLCWISVHSSVPGPELMLNEIYGIEQMGHVSKFNSTTC